MRGALGEQRKPDPYAASLAKGTVHADFHDVVRGHAIAGSGDFRGSQYGKQVSVTVPQEKGAR